MRFTDPHWLIAGVLAGAGLFALWRLHDVRQRAALARFVAPHLKRRLIGSVSGILRNLQRGLQLISILALCAALAGPLFGYTWEKVNRRGNEVVFAIDTSRSMLTPDVKPNRLFRAKLAIDDMARQLGGDGIGMVAFAGSAFLVCPLTLDHAAFHQSLDAIDIGTIPKGGTNIPSAIQAAESALRRRPGSDRILILVTDGENLEGDALAAAEAAATQVGLKIYTVGVGTVDGDLIPLPPDKGGGFVKDEKGALVRSHLDEAGLSAIAKATAGSYVHLSDQGEDFDAFLQTIFGTVSKHDLAYRQQKIYIQRYQWPLAASLLSLLGSLLVGTRRLRRQRMHASAAEEAPSRVRAITTSAVLTLISLHAIPERSESADQAGAAGASHPAKPIAEYNAGTGAYRTGNFGQAAKSFQQSINAAPSSDARRLRDQQDAYYDLGNALYRAGQQLEKSAPDKAVEKWTDAVKAYDTALQLRPDDADSKFNRDYVHRKIDALKQPPPPSSGGGKGQGNGGASGNGKGQGHGQPPPPQGQPSQGQPSQAPPASPQSQPFQADTANDQSSPGHMSPEDARELLDSARSDEHQSLAAGTPPPDKATRDW